MMGLKRNDALFPKNVNKGAKIIAATYAVMYQAFEGVKEKLGLDKNLTWHSSCYKRDCAGSEKECGQRIWEKV